MLRRFVPMLLLVSAACADLPTEPLGGLELRTDRVAYAPGETVSFTVSNGSAGDAFFFHCDYRLSYVLEEATAGGWIVEHHAGPICPAIYATGVKVLTPGSAYVANVPVARSGTFRIRMATGTTSSGIGSVHITSAPFTIE